MNELGFESVFDVVMLGVIEGPTHKGREKKSKGKSVLALTQISFEVLQQKEIFVWLVQVFINFSSSLFVALDMLNPIDIFLAQQINGDVAVSVDIFDIQIDTPPHILSSHVITLVALDEDIDVRIFGMGGPHGQNYC